MAETAPQKARSNGVKPTKTRRYFTPDEVGKLVDAVGRTAYPERNRLLVLMMYRHGLRVSEATGLRWLDLDLKRRTLHVHRLKGGKDAVHMLQRDEVEALQRLQGDSPFVFVFRRQIAAAMGVLHSQVHTRNASSGWPARAACKPAVRCASNSACKVADRAGTLSSGSVMVAPPRTGGGHALPVLVLLPSFPAGALPKSDPLPVLPALPVPSPSAPSCPSSSAAGVAGFGSSSGRTKPRSTRRLPSSASVSTAPAAATSAGVHTSSLASKAASSASMLFNSAATSSGRSSALPLCSAASSS